jgi:aerobic carbon-monoxide dehydrogenase large subunit
MIVRGQIQGGVVQGIGQALMEHQVYDRQSGQLLTASFMDYAMPRAVDLPNVDADLEEVACKTNPLGVKGIGESGTIGAPPTVINAVIARCRQSENRRGSPESRGRAATLGVMLYPGAEGVTRCAPGLVCSSTARRKIPP